jgi:hypothetical protein
MYCAAQKWLGPANLEERTIGDPLSAEGLLGDSLAWFHIWEGGLQNCQYCSNYARNWPGLIFSFSIISSTGDIGINSAMSMLIKAQEHLYSSHPEKKNWWQRLMMCI